MTSFLWTISRVSKEEFSAQSVNLDLNVTQESFMVRETNIVFNFVRDLTHATEERLVYIYVFTAIVAATVIVTLCRSFLFFNVSPQLSFARGTTLTHHFFPSVGDACITKPPQRNVQRCHSGAHVFLPHKPIRTYFEPFLEGHGSSRRDPAIGYD